VAYKKRQEQGLRSRSIENQGVYFCKWLFSIQA